MIISELFHEESYLEIYKHPRVFDKYMEIITITAEFNNVTIRFVSQNQTGFNSLFI